MAASATEAGFIVWGIDQTAYGPVELPTLVAWVKDERVTADTWVYAAKNSSWQKAISSCHNAFGKAVTPIAVMIG